MPPDVQAQIRALEELPEVITKATNRIGLVRR